jgi:hypothetical protein
VIEVAGQIRRMKYRETMCGACPEHPVSKFANRDFVGLQGIALCDYAYCTCQPASGASLTCSHGAPQGLWLHGGKVSGLAP